MMAAWVVNGCMALFIVWGCVSMLRRGRRKSGGLVISPMAGLALGAMLTGLQAIVHPQVRHLIAEQQEEKSVEDEGSEPLGGREFHAQLKRIRSGKMVDGVTVRVDRCQE